MPEPTTATLHVTVKAHEKRLDGHDDLIAKIQNRPPVWMGAIFSVVLGLLCALAGFMMGN